MKKKVLITGGCGFIGFNIYLHLKESDKYDPVVVDDLTFGQNFDKDSMKHYQYSVQDYDVMDQLFQVEMPDFVIHLCGRARIQPSIDDPMSYHDNNVLGTLTMLELSRKYKVKKFLFASSSSVYAGCKTPFKEAMKLDPKNPYATTKLIMEKYARMYSSLYGLETIGLRFFNVYGKHMTKGQYSTVMNIFMEQVKVGEELTIVDDGEQRRDFTHVDDIIDAIMRIIESDRNLGGEVFNLGANDPHSVNEVADLIAGKGYARSFEHKRIGEVDLTEASIKKAEKLLGWKPKIKLKEGIKNV